MMINNNDNMLITYFFILLGVEVFFVNTGKP